MATHSMVDYTTKIKSFFSSKQELSGAYAVFGELGAKNLITYQPKHQNPFFCLPYYSRGIAYTLNADGSILLNGTTTAANSNIVLHDSFLPGKYILSTEEMLPLDVYLQVYDTTNNTFIAYIGNTVNKSREFTVSEEQSTHNLIVRLIISRSGVSLNNLTCKPMLRHAADTNSEWCPFVMTNSQLTDFVMGKPVYIMCWGDSLTAQGGWTDKLQELSGIRVYNGGVGGEDVKTIMARQGGDVMVVNNITIPATIAPVTIARKSVEGGVPTEMGNSITPALSSAIDVVISGILGTLSWNGNSSTDTNGEWVFTRTTSGDELVIDRPTAMRTRLDMCYNNSTNVMIIFMGQNGGYTNDSELINMHKLMIEHFKGKEYVVLGLASGTATSRADYEAAMTEAFGRRFISLRQYLAHPIYENGEIVSCYGLADQGLTPTTDDLEKIAIGRVPAQCLTDGTHFTTGTRTVIGNMLYKKMCELNIL